jgi:hypothetical protein
MTEGTTPETVGLQAVLHAAGPAPDAELTLFGQFVGSWALTWTGWAADGSVTRQVGELHFGWVLGGRAVQDVWRVPNDEAAARANPSIAFHGSTIRFYDPTLQAWRSTWIEPINGRVRRFTGRPDDEGIVLTSDEDSPILRWRFRDITPTSFRWTSESSPDGDEWRLDEEMLATRQTPAG